MDFFPCLCRFEKYWLLLKKIMFGLKNVYVDLKNFGFRWSFWASSLKSKMLKSYLSYSHGIMSQWICLSGIGKIWWESTLHTHRSSRQGDQCTSAFLNIEHFLLLFLHFNSRWRVSIFYPRCRFLLAVDVLLLQANHNRLMRLFMELNSSKLAVLQSLKWLICNLTPHFFKLRIYDFLTFSSLICLCFATSEICKIYYRVAIWYLHKGEFSWFDVMGTKVRADYLYFGILFGSD